jgi:DNA-binding XRE family transcriptional regulator
MPRRLDALEVGRIRRRLRARMAAGNAGTIRENAGIDRTTMARHVGVKRPTLINWEEGRAEPRDLHQALAWLSFLDELERELAAEQKPDDAGGLEPTGTEGGGSGATATQP